MTQPSPIAALNALPANEVCDLAVVPHGYREAFRPRHSFGQHSPLVQHREQTVLENNYDTHVRQDRVSMSLLRGLMYGLAIEAVAGIIVAAYLVATGRY